ncbi:MAG: hypothetical protein U9O87_10030 [Verrucomicrobiota bacterium]|nr:hypothetical protein [Verrucomicrobiota bacterium]
MSLTKETDNLQQKRYNRVNLTLFCFSLLMILQLMRLSYFMIFGREEILKDITEKALFKGSIPAMRGRILDYNENVLAWSTRHFAIVWNIPKNQPTALKQLEMLKIDVPCWQLLIENSTNWNKKDKVSDISVNIFIENHLGKTIILDNEINPGILHKFLPLFKNCNAFTSQTYFIRHYSKNIPKNIIGELKTINGEKIGISGLEKVYNKKIQGTPAEFEVMLDEKGKWLYETWKKTKEMKPGYDVNVNISDSPQTKNIE